MSSDTPTRRFLCLLGRQPALGLAELEALYSPDAIVHISNDACILRATTLDFPRLGGIVKAAEIIEEVPAGTIRALTPKLRTIAASILNTDSSPDGKINLGLSAYGPGGDARAINAVALELKKHLRADGRSVRIVPNKTPVLSSAQTLHNNLTSSRGLELAVYLVGNRCLIGRVSNIQDIDAYAARDHGRPKRDAKNGMLPPKLAQIIINLAVGRSSPPMTILDPFCGTGVVLQEALLMGYKVIGSDLESRMRDYTRDNLAWLERSTSSRQLPPYAVAQSDAMQHSWKSFDAVAAETYLGDPLRTAPDKATLAAIVARCDQIHRAFLKNIHGQMKPGSRLCLAVPAWSVHGKLKHLPLIDALPSLGYNRIDFTHAKASELVYLRDSQRVARELLVLKRK